MVKPPVVQAAGMLRAVGRGIDTTAWAWLCESAGQYLFYAAERGGWDDTRWLDTATFRGRWQMAQQVLRPGVAEPREAQGARWTRRSSSTALRFSRARCRRPMRAGCSVTRRQSSPIAKEDWQKQQYPPMLTENALRI